MSETEARSESEKSLRRVRRFYHISAQREWERLVHPTQGALEFAINRAWIARFLPPPGARVLDIGGGPGRYAIWLAEQGYRVTLADLSPDLLTVAKEKAAEAGVELEGFVEADARELVQFEAGCFDAVLCLGPLYHLLLEEDRRAAVRQLHRVARPGAPVFVAFLNRLQVLRVAVNQDMPIFTPYTFDLVKRWHEEGVFITPVPGIFTDAYFIQPRDVLPLMESAGFETAELVSSQSIAADVQKHLALFAERQPELYEWALAEFIEQADEPSTLGSGFHILYIGEKP